MREHHSVRHYADKLCITSNYLNEIVNSAMGMSAKQYIQNKVMEEAKRLLAGVCINREKYYFSLCFCYADFLLCPYLCLIQ